MWLLLYVIPIEMFGVCEMLSNHLLNGDFFRSMLSVQTWVAHWPPPICSLYALSLLRVTVNLGPQRLFVRDARGVGMPVICLLFWVTSNGGWGWCSVIGVVRWQLAVNWNALRCLGRRFPRECVAYCLIFASLDSHRWNWCNIPIPASLEHSCATTPRSEGKSILRNVHVPCGRCSGRATRLSKTYCTPLSQKPYVSFLLWSAEGIYWWGHIGAFLSSDFSWRHLCCLWMG